MRNKLSRYVLAFCFCLFCGKKKSVLSFSFMYLPAVFHYLFFFCKNKDIEGS